MANPYQPPAGYPDPNLVPPGGGGRPGVDLEKLRNIARQQRNINLAILAQLSMYGYTSIGRESMAHSQVGAIIAGVLFLSIGIFSIVATIRLANALHGTGVAVVCAILMFIPCISLITLLVLNSQATKRAKDAGYKVGLLGADPGDIR